MNTLFNNFCYVLAVGCLLCSCKYGGRLNGKDETQVADTVCASSDKAVQARLAAEIVHSGRTRNKVFHIYVPDVYIPKGCSEDDVILEIFGSDSLKSIILLAFDDTNCVIKQNLTPGEESMSLYDTLYHKVIASIKGCEGDLSEYNGMESISVHDTTRIIDRRYILFGPGFAESKGRLFVWGGVDNPHKEIIEVNEKYNNIQTIFPYMAVCRDYYVDNESVLYIFKKGDIRKMRKKKLGSPLTESSMFDFYPVWYYTPKSLKIQ